uniref:ARAD1D22088p n=1 Tax=Blastobotrys adeninivorans TaxID=409370 RepID=A0A060TGB1_BLAAD
MDKCRVYRSSLWLLFGVLCCWAYWLDRSHCLYKVVEPAGPVAAMNYTIYTPKTYGIQGVQLKGFKVDDILTPGSSYNPAEISGSTMSLLKFHLKRSMLNAVLALVGYYESSPEPLKAPFRAKSEPLAIADQPEGPIGSFARAICQYLPQARPIYSWIYGYHKSSAELWFREINSTGPRPVHILAFLHYEPRVAPPPPQLLTYESHEELTKEEILAIEDEIRRDRLEAAIHHQTQRRRLIHEISDFMVWCVVCSIPNVSFYDQNGVITKNDLDDLVESFQAKAGLIIGKAPECFEIAFPLESMVTRYGQSDNDSNSGLHVSIIPGFDVKQIYVEVAKTVASELNVGDEQIEVLIQESVFGVSKEPDLVMFPCRNAETRGFPLELIRKAHLFFNPSTKPVYDGRVILSALKSMQEPIS